MSDPFLGWKRGDKVRWTLPGGHRFVGTVLYFTTCLGKNLAVCDWRAPNGSLMQHGAVVGDLEYAFAARDRFHNGEARESDPPADVLLREVAP